MDAIDIRLREIRNPVVTVKFSKFSSKPIMHNQRDIQTNTTAMVRATTKRMQKDRVNGPNTLLSVISIFHRHLPLFVLLLLV